MEQVRVYSSAYKASILLCMYSSKTKTYTSNFYLCGVEISQQIRKLIKIDKDNLICIQVSMELVKSNECVL